MEVLKFFLLILSVVSTTFSLPTKSDEPSCGYQTCPQTDPNKLNVHLIAHSHDDLGWLWTVDNYFYTKVQYIISSVVAALKENPERRFIQVETYNFYEWWQLQSDVVKQDVRDLINQGRLEIINGGWSMNDEAATHYQSIIDQLTLGHRWLDQEFGKCAHPKTGWHIDIFGHSREQASLYKQMAFDSFLVGRIDYRDERKRKAEKTTDMWWKSSDDLPESEILTSYVYRAYNNPPNLCFDITCDKRINDDEESPDYNLKDFVNNMTKYVSEQAKAYPTNNVMVTVGDDVHFRGASTNFANLEKLIKGFKKYNPEVDGKKINIFYSTPSCYAYALNQAVKTNKINLVTKSDDFLPYATSETGYWTGFYTSRVTTKRFERIANNLAQIAKQLIAASDLPIGESFYLESVLGIMQHHDAITGTEVQEVLKDYQRMIHKAIERTVPVVGKALTKALGLTEDLQVHHCPLANISICEHSRKDEFSVLVYNPLAQPVTQYVQIPVNNGKYQVTGPKDVVKSQLADPVQNFKYASDYLHVDLNSNVLFFKAENLPPLGFNVYTIKKTGNLEVDDGNFEEDIVKEMIHEDFENDIKEDPISSFKEIDDGNFEEDITKITINEDFGKVINEDRTWGFKDTNVILSGTTGFLKSITINGLSIELEQEMMAYRSAYGSGIYMFEPDPKQRDALKLADKVENKFIDGELCKEVRQSFQNWVTQVIRICDGLEYIEIDYFVGPIYTEDKFGKDVISRFKTSFRTNALYYTDANGRQTMQRKRNYRPTYNYTNELFQSANYYPITSRASLRDEAMNLEFGVVTDRSHGAASLADGQLEIMLARASLRPEFNNENGNDKEFEAGVRSRGSLYLTVGRIKPKDGEKSASVIQKEVAIKKQLAPWTFYLDKPINQKSFSILKEPFPETLRLLSYQKWSDSQFLVRIEHILAKNDDPNLSKSVTIDLEKYFKIKSIKEVTLNGVTNLDQITTFGEATPRKSHLNGNQLTLAPMEIATMILELNK